jgi:superfamily II DNA or RNA helicase
VQFAVQASLPKRPRLRVFAAPVLIPRQSGLACELDEVVAPLLKLEVEDEAAEREARQLLERLGAVDLACVDAAPPPEVDADYVVRLDAGPHAYCAFTENALPRLRALGWSVEVAADYPFHVAPASTPWFARVERAERSGWFSLEIGVEVDGERVDLLPLVLDLLDDADEADGLRSLARRARASYALKLDDTRHVTLSPERLRALLHVVIELYLGVRTKGAKIAFPAARAPALAKLDLALKKCGARLTWEDPTKLVERAAGLALRPAPAAPPAELRATLRPYQAEGVAFLQHLVARGVGGILADDMGLGKTLQTIAHICTEKAGGRLDKPALVVAPTTLAFNWARELERFAPHLSALVLHGPSRRAKRAKIDQSDVVITTYPLLVRDEQLLAGHAFRLFVLDEAQAIKNTRSQVHRAIKSVRADHTVCLTGTPVENHLGELWALFDVLVPGLLGDELAFLRAYKKPIEALHDEERLTSLKELVAPFILRRVKRDVAKELPPKTELHRGVELGGKQRELYESIRVAAHADVRKLIRVKGLAASTIPILDALMKLRQVCCDPRLLAMDTARDVRESAKYDMLFELLDTQLAQGHKILVFSQFTSMLALIAEGLRARRARYAVLTGQTRDRRAVVDAFERGDADVFLISLKAGGTGLNLVSADTVIHYDPWWNPAAQAQATDRAYRIGQTRPVFVHNLYVAGSVEERVVLLQRKKRWLSATLLGDEGAGSAALSAHEIDALFAPLDG